MSDESVVSGYSKPPILEVVMEIRFVEAIAEERVALASQRVASRYANMVQEEQIEASADFEQRTASFDVTGRLVRHSSKDETDVISISTTNVAWAKRAPYEGWDQFMGRIKADMRPVLKALQHPPIGRLGLRYINRIDVPIGDDGLTRYEDYINYHINAGPYLEPSIGYQWAMTSYRPADNLIVTLTSAAVQPEIPGTGAFTFDIDVATESGVPRDLEGIEARLDTMRRLKNSIFEDGISDQAKALYA